MSINRYLDKETLLSNIEYKDIGSNDLISADSYNEDEIMNKYNSIDKDGQELLLKAAIHISIIGYGNRTYGMIRDKNNNILEIKDVFDKYHICYNRNISEKYDTDTLSARRLIRLLRYHIQKFIIETKRPSFLWIKYSDRNEKMMSICFPGGEHLVETQEEALYLYNTYKNIDSLMNSKFHTRLERIYIARRIFPAAMFNQKV